jgi:hypothetical protein
VNRKTLFAALACALLVFSMLGCGASNTLKSVQISTSNSSEVPMGAQDLQGITSTIQLYAWGNYSNGKAVLLNSVGDVTWSVVLDPIYNVDAFGNPLPAPPQGVEISTTGLITSVEPAFCTWVDEAPVTLANPTPTPSWAISGQYDVTFSYRGLISPPVAMALADTAGDPNNPALGNPGGVDNNPNALCGPSSNP